MKLLTSRRMVAAAVCAMALAAGRMSFGAHEAEQTRQILAATGVKGGLIVHLGVGDGRLTAALRANDGFLVHGLDSDARNVEAARKHIQSAGLYGPVSVEQWTDKRLPYADNLVNLLLVSDDGRVTRDEMLRVLVPNGVALSLNPKSGIQSASGGPKSVKPRPKELDEWTHYLYDANNNAVSRDKVVDLPRRMQWIGSPKWARHHDHMASMSALVTANGRVFYIMDDGPRSAIMLPASWSLVARDAFNGTILWKRPIAEWNTHLWPLKSGPNQLPRRLVALGDTVYVTLGIDAPLTALDAATGQTLRTYDGTQHTDEVLLSDGVLFLLVASSPNKWKDYRPKHTYVWDNTNRANREWAWDMEARSIVAVQADSGKVLWRKETRVAPLTLAVSPERVYFHDGEKVVSLNRKNGQEAWSSEPVVRKQPIPTGYGPTLVVQQGVALVSVESKAMTAFDAATGKKLWTADHHRGGHASPDDLLVINGVVWSGAVADGKDTGVFTGRDLRTGEVKSEFLPDVQSYWFHHRCYRAKATERFVMTSRTGIEFVDLAAKHWTINHWVRGGCIYGIMPANGMVYAPPHSCGCYLESKLFGFTALAPAAQKAEGRSQRSDGDRLERGPAFAGISDLRFQISDGADWPTYRHDAARSGATKASVPANLKLAWQTKVGGKLSSVTVAEGKVLVASVDAHTVYALDASSGKLLWSYTAGGRVDSPPTVWQGRVLFRCSDGFVYCLRAEDGQLAWRFHAAPDERRMMAFEQLESAWPVHGSVLVLNDVLYCTAGRSVFLDGGIRFLKLDPTTGRKLGEVVLDDRDPETGEDLQKRLKGLDMPVALSDVLTSDGQFIYMRSQQFDLEGKRLQITPIGAEDQTGDGVHLFSRTGLLDGDWFHRSYWMYGKGVSSGYGGWFRPGRVAPSGRIMVFDDATAYGFDRKPESVCNASVYEYYLYAANKAMDTGSIRRLASASARIDAASDKKSANASDWKLRKGFPICDLTAVGFKWAEANLPIQARAMALADKTLFVAGPPDVVDEEKVFGDPDAPELKAKLTEQVAALEGRKGSQVWAFSAVDGKRLAAYELGGAMPVFDGMAAASGKLVLAMSDGSVVCLAADGAPLKAAPAVELVTLDTSVKTPPPPPTPKSADADFQKLSQAQAFVCDLGYRVTPEPGKNGFALKRLPTPLTGRATLKAKMKSTAGTALPKPLKNGLIVFGDTAEDDRLVKCGLRIAMRKAVIIQGPFTGGKTVSEDAPIDEATTHELTIVADLGSGEVTMKVGACTVKATLDPCPKSISYVGYGVMNAVTDFSPIDVASK